MLTLGFFALPFIKKIWSMNNTSSSGDEKYSKISADTTFQGGDAKPPQIEEDQVDRMSTDLILQNPVWAAIYRRGWADRSVDFQRSQELGQHDQHLDVPNMNSDPTSESSEPSPVVKIRTEAQQARVRKNLLKLKEKKKAKRQLANEQKC
ncbi:uncharacterized protein LOC132921714 [Rhopalosiphum padi]|uniref:uncharacterized protein LOC132921714 n=1 Tax=Rhopalosiphum padi TaxID=40932 RepID=UPI00298D8A19|nr:uncharacterized protein LOC132921714 [Rhopalosiphum padi]